MTTIQWFVFGLILTRLFISMVEKKHFFFIQHSIASSKFTDVNDMNARFDGKNIHEPLNSNRIEEEESIKQIEIVPKKTSDVTKTCESISFTAGSFEDCRLDVEHNDNNNHEKTNVLAECSACEIISEVENEQSNEGVHSIEEVQECETIKQFAKAIDVDQSRLDESKRATINFFCENLDELKVNF